MATFSVGSNARDYPDIDSFVADLPATLTEQMIAQLYNDSEFVSSSTVYVTGVTATETNNIIIEAATSESFRDSGNHLRYDAANGVGIRKSSSYGYVIDIDVPYTIIRGLQISTTGTANTMTVHDDSNITFIGNLIESSSNVRVITSESAASTYVNNIIIANEGAATGTEGIRVSYTAPTLINNTIVSMYPGSTAFGIEKLGATADGSTVKNNAIFGFATALESGTWGAGSDYNATDDDTLPIGTNNLTSLVFADQFEDISSSAALDLRLKTGNSLDGAGVQDSLTDDEDVFYTARSVTAPSIGAFETASTGGGNESAISFNDEVATFSAIIINTPINNESTVSFSDTSPEFTASIVNDVNNNTSNISFVDSRAEFNASITNNANSNISSVSFSDVNAQFIASVVNAAVNNESSIAFIDKKQVFTANINNEAENNSLNVLFSDKRAEFSATLTNAFPPNESLVSFSDESPEFSAAIQNGEVVVKFNSETNYTQAYLSTDYSQDALSTNYNQPYLSTNYTQG